MEEQGVYKMQKDEGSQDSARKRVHAQRGSIDKGPDRKVDVPVRATKKFFVFMYVVSMAIRIPFELARKGGIQGGSLM